MIRTMRAFCRGIDQDLNLEVDLLVDFLHGLAKSARNIVSLLIVGGFVMAAISMV